MKRSSSWGFTLIELLLVLVIMGIIAAVTVPSVARSMRGNRLRSAARTVVMAGRYARSMAVLHQHEMKVSFDLARGIVWITPYDPPHPLDDDDTDATNGDDPVDEAPPPAWEAVDVPEEMEPESTAHVPTGLSAEVHSTWCLILQPVNGKGGP